MDNSKCPPVDPALVKHLAEVFPDSLNVLSLHTSDREVGLKMGEVGVVRYLRECMEDQHKNMMGD